MPSRTRVAAPFLALAALAGCGSSDGKKTSSTPDAAVQGDQRGVVETIDALQIASRSGDGGRICADIFTPKLVRSIEASSTRGCAAEVRERLFKPQTSISVQRGIDVTGATASAVIREQNGNLSTLHLLKQAGRWRIDRVTPQKGK